MQPIWKIKYQRRRKSTAHSFLACEYRRKGTICCGKHAGIEHQRFISVSMGNFGVCLAPHCVRISLLCCRLHQRGNILCNSRKMLKLVAKCVQMCSSELYNPVDARFAKLSMLPPVLSELRVRSLASTGDIFPVHQPTHTLTTRIHI